MVEMCRQGSVATSLPGQEQGAKSQAAESVAGLNPTDSVGWWGGLDRWAGSCPRPSLGCCCLLEAIAGDGSVCCLDKAVPSQCFLH